MIQIAHGHQAFWTKQDAEPVLLTQGDDDGDENGDDGDGSAFSSGSFRPGKVVWAKVDGHEWWPAKVCTHT